MLIILHADEYLPDLPALGAEDAFTAFVEVLAATLTAGEHAISCKPRLMLEFAELEALSGNQRRVFREVGRDLTRPDGHLDLVTDALVLTGPSAGSPKAAPSGQRWFRRAWTRVRSVADLRQTVMAAENGNDARWYRWLARAYSVRARPRLRPSGGDVNLACHGLGGSTTGDELGAFVRDGHPTLCIADSDRPHPDAPLGDTAKNIHRAIEGLDGSAPVVCVTLEARDLENMMPIPVLEVAIRNAEWLEPMVDRGFFVGPTRPLNASLAYLDLGKDQCGHRLREEKAGDAATIAYHTRAIEEMQASAASSVSDGSGCPDRPCPEGSCAARPDGARGFSSTPAGCRLVFSVGKGKRGAVAKAVALLDDPRRRAVFEKQAPEEWLAAQLPPPSDDEEPPLTGPVWSVARRAWSWGLCRRPRNPAAR